MKYWKLKPGVEQSEYQVYLVSSGFKNGGPLDDQVWWEATVKWDGCVHLHQYNNMPANDEERVLVRETGKYAGNGIEDPLYLHLCGIGDGTFAAMIQELGDIGRVLFAKKHPDQWK